MSKGKIYPKRDIPDSVADIVKAICADYDRREKDIAKGSIKCETKKLYKYLNGIIDMALEEIEIGIRRSILDDISGKRGYDRSAINYSLSKNAYYRRKRKLIYDIAKSLKLL